MRVECTVNDKQVTIPNAGVHHRVPGDCHDECGVRMIDDMFVEAEIAVEVILCDRGESGVYGFERLGHRGGVDISATDCADSAGMLDGTVMARYGVGIGE